MRATGFVSPLLLVAFRFITGGCPSSYVLAAGEPWPFPASRARRLKRPEQGLILPGEFIPLIRLSPTTWSLVLMVAYMWCLPPSRKAFADLRVRGIDELAVAVPCKMPGSVGWNEGDVPCGTRAWARR